MSNSESKSKTATAAPSDLSTRESRKEMFESYFHAPATNVLSEVQTVTIRILAQLDHADTDSVNIITLAKFLDDFYYFCNDCE